MMKLKKGVLVIYLIIIILVPLIFRVCANYCSSVNEKMEQKEEMNHSQYNNFLGNIIIIVDIYNIDSLNKEADVQLFLDFERARNFPHNASKIGLVIIGGEGGQYNYVYIELSHLLDSYYCGRSDVMKWHLLGSGDLFPFDSYKIEFCVDSTFSYRVGNKTSAVWRSEDYPVGSHDDYFNVTLYNECATISEEKQETLSREWKSLHDLQIPLSSYYEEGFVIELERKSIIPILEFILPIVTCYYLLGTSMFIKRHNLSDRLRVYIALFIFSSTFFFSIQSFLPLRNFLSIPEILLINLTTSSAIFAIFSMIPTRARKENIVDSISILISIIILYSTLFIIERSIKVMYLFFIIILGLYWALVLKFTSVVKVFLLRA